MSQVSEAKKEITQWLSAAFVRVKELGNAGQSVQVALLLPDIEQVVQAYMAVINQFIPQTPVQPIPKNFFGQLAWLAKNLPWLQILVAAVTGVNPFEEAKQLARTIANKWDFADEAYKG